MRATCRTCRRTRADVGIAGYCDPCATRKTAEYERSRAQLRADLPDGCDVLADACADALADARELPVINAGCPRCGQQTLAFPGTTCATCREQDRQSQGDQFALFTPTAAPINGQQTL